MGDHSLIAFLPQDGSWCQQDFPHMTFIYAGKTAELNPSDFNLMAKDAISAGRLMGSFNLQVLGVEELGENEDAVDALVFYPTPQLLIARKLVEKWDTGEFPVYKPHGTIGPAGSAFQNTDPYVDPYSDSYTKRNSSLPLNVYFNRLAVCWGDQRLIFNLSDLY